MKSTETYKLVERETSDLYSVQITSGPFKGVIFTYGKVSFREGENGIPVLSFQYKIEESPLPSDLLKSIPEFKNTLGDILHDMLEAQYIAHDRLRDTTNNNTE